MLIIRQKCIPLHTPVFLYILSGSIRVHITSLGNLFMPSGLFYLSFWTGNIPIEDVSGYFLLLPCFIEIPVFNANSIYLDQICRI